MVGHPDRERENRGWEGNTQIFFAAMYLKCDFWKILRVFPFVFQMGKRQNAVVSILINPQSQVYVRELPHALADDAQPMMPSR